MVEGTEWAIHCCSLLAVLPHGATMPAARLAEFHDVPPAYLAKHLQSLSAAGIVESTSGPRGGYRLGRAPAEITLLDVVLAVDGDQHAFRCTEVRRRGPSGARSERYVAPCGIAGAMWRAEQAWRDELACTTVADVVQEMFHTVSPAQLARGAAWIEQVIVRRRTAAEEDRA